MGDTQRWVPNGDDGAWSADFQVSSATLGDVAVTGRCGLTTEGWDYAPSTVNVVFDGEHGTKIEPRLWLSHPIVTAGYGLSVSGLGCSSEVQVQVGEHTEWVTPEAGEWRAGVLIPEGTLGELPVTATCTGDDAATYPATVANVVADGKLGFPPIPDAGGGVPAPTTSTPTPRPALPHTGW